MEKEQELEWAEAQRITINEDLVAAAKEQLQFLAAVDRNRHLYDGPALEKEIYRYKHCWLPLLAKYSDYQAEEGPLVVPLDCEWVWHCHRLNPVRYKNDCVELYGRILDNRNVESSVRGTCWKQTEAMWSNMFPNEPYELNISTQLSENVAQDAIGAHKTTTYDLVSAVKRQSSFFYQVSKPCMSDDLFLEEAVARYKGFLHMIKRNQERSIRRFCVPTYDIDLIWHSHQLNPVSYSEDLVALIGRILDHDDTDSDRSKGQKLDTGFSGTTKQWEETFGTRYWKAGAMHKGSAPSPLKINFSLLDNVSKKSVLSNKLQNTTLLPKKTMLEVMLETVEVRDLPAMHKGSLFVTLRKKQPDTLFNGKITTSILSETGEKDVAVFQCEPNGELVFELMSYSTSALPIARPAKMLGTTSLSLQDLVNPVSQLSEEKWFELAPSSGVVGSKPIHLRIAISFTPPVPAPYVLQMIRMRSFSTSCFFPRAKSTFFVYKTGNEIISIQMRDLTSMDGENNDLLKKEVIGITPSGEKHVLADFGQRGWSLMNSSWRFQLRNKFSEKGYIIELTGSRKVILFPGRKLEYETRTCEKSKHEQNFMTAVDFSAEHPYGKAVALFNLKSGFLKINEEWLVLPGIVLAFLFKEGYISLSSKRGNSTEVDNKLQSEFSENLAEGTEVMPSKDSSNDDWLLANTSLRKETAGCGSYRPGAKSSDIVPERDIICKGEHDNERIRCRVQSGNCSSGCGNCGGGGCGGECGGGGGCGPQFGSNSNACIGKDWVETGPFKPSSNGSATCVGHPRAIPTKENETTVA